MSKTLLAVVQDILSDANGDEINSLSDTVEANQCASIVRSVYEDIIAEYDLQGAHTLFELTGLGNTNLPTHMTLPSGIHSVEWVKYDARTSSSDPRKFRTVPFVVPAEFMERTNPRSTLGSVVQEVTDPSGAALYILNNAAPSFYTMFEDNTLVFDSFNSDVEATLHQNSTQAYGQQARTLVIADATVLDLPDPLVNLVVNEARAMFFDVHAGGATQRVERRASRSRVRAQRLRHPLRDKTIQANKYTGGYYGRR